MSGQSKSTHSLDEYAMAFIGFADTMKANARVIRQVTGHSAGAIGGVDETAEILVPSGDMPSVLARAALLNRDR